MSVKDFRSYFGEFIALVTAGVATTALILVSSLSGFVPPWPDSVIQVTAIFQLIVLVFVYQFCKSAPKRTINRMMISGLFVAVLVCTVYLSIFSILVYDLPDGTRSLRGISCTDEATLLYESFCPLLTVTQIGDAGFVPGKLWTPFGLMISRVALFLVWMTFFASLVGIFALFIVYQRRLK